MNIEIKKSIKPINYFDAINLLEKRLENLYNNIENTIIETLKSYKIDTFSDKNNIGIWYSKNQTINKVAAIGVRVKKWIAYHGFAININNNLTQYKKIIPCGIKDKGVTNLVNISDNDYSNLDNLLIEKFISNLKT
jgi:lipoyl(octanoyl) transferase